MNRLKQEDILSIELGQEYANQCNEEIDRLEHKVDELTNQLREQARLIVNSSFQKEKTPKVELNKIKIERKY